MVKRLNEKVVELFTQILRFSCPRKTGYRFWKLYFRFHYRNSYGCGYVLFFCMHFALENLSLIKFRAFLEYIRNSRLRSRVIYQEIDANFPSRDRVRSFWVVRHLHCGNTWRRYRIASALIRLHEIIFFFWLWMSVGYSHIMQPEVIIWVHFLRIRWGI